MVLGKNRVGEKSSEACEAAGVALAATSRQAIR
jgi:hypothetical protein